MSDFIYKLNAMELAACAANPAELGYADKRRAVLSHVDGLERALARFEQAERELPDLSGRPEDQSPASLWAHIQALRAHAAKVTAERDEARSWLESEHDAHMECHRQIDGEPKVIELVGAINLIREPLNGGNVQDLLFTINSALDAAAQGEGK